MTNKVIFNGGLGNTREFGYSRSDVFMDGSSNTFAFAVPFEAKLGIGGMRFQSFMNVPVTIDATLCAPKELTSAGDMATLSIWGLVKASLAPLALEILMPPITGLRFTAIPPAATATTVFSWLAGVVTVTSTAHGLSTGDLAVIAGVTPVGYNGTFQVTKLTNDTFTYPLAANPGAVTAQGTAAIVPRGMITVLVT